MDLAVIDMIMTELRLPRRMVLDLADVVHKKTQGHSYFVVSMLNELLREGIISYSPQKVQCPLLKQSQVYWMLFLSLLISYSIIHSSVITGIKRELPASRLEILLQH